MTPYERAQRALKQADAELEQSDILHQQAERRRGNRRADEAPPKFTCPVCGHQTSKIVNSRSNASSRANADEVVKRRRECRACHARYTTVERIVRDSVAPSKKSA